MTGFVQSLAAVNFLWLYPIILGILPALMIRGKIYIGLLGAVMAMPTIATALGEVSFCPTFRLVGDIGTTGCTVILALLRAASTGRVKAGATAECKFRAGCKLLNPVL